MYFPSKYLHIPTAGRVGICRYLCSKYMQIHADSGKLVNVLFYSMNPNQRVPLEQRVPEAGLCTALIMRLRNGFVVSHQAGDHIGNIGSCFLGLFGSDRISPATRLPGRVEVFNLVLGDFQRRSEKARRLANGTLSSNMSL